MKHETVTYPKGFIPLVLSPEQVLALSHDVVLPGVIDAARWALAVHERDNQATPVEVKQVEAVAHVSARLREAIWGTK